MSWIQTYKKQSFHPNLISIFINPFLLIRWMLLRKIKKYAPKLQGSILDFGCGQKPYQALFTQATEYVGVDIENEAHNHDTEDIDFFYDGRKLPFESEHFDNIFASESLEHVFNYEEIIPELYRVLKPGGQILVTVPFAWEEHEIPYDNCRFTKYGIKSLLESHNFKIESVETSGHFFAVIAQYWINYLRELFYTQNKYLNLVINLMVISPFTVLAIILSAIAPKKESLYFNTVILARK